MGKGGKTPVWGRFKAGRGAEFVRERREEKNPKFWGGKLRSGGSPPKKLRGGWSEKPWERVEEGPKFWGEEKELR